MSKIRAKKSEVKGHYIRTKDFWEAAALRQKLIKLIPVTKLRSKTK